MRLGRKKAPEQERLTMRRPTALVEIEERIDMHGNHVEYIQMYWGVVDDEYAENAMRKARKRRENQGTCDI